MSFVHLHVHSEYSMSDGIVRIPALARTARECGMPAVALTDYCNLFAAVKFYRAALAQGVKPILGAELPIADAGASEIRGTLVALCTDETGYRRLSDLISRAYREGQLPDGSPAVVAEWLSAEAFEGLIVLSGGLNGDVARIAARDDLEGAARLMRWYRDALGDRYYVEITRTSRRLEQRVMAALSGLAADLGIPLVASNDVRFVRAADFDAHEARICIHQGRTLADQSRPRAYSPEQYLKDGDEMHALFADLPDAIANARAIAMRCNYRFELGRYHMPEYPIPGGADVDDALREQTKEGLEARLAAIAGATGAPLDEAEYWRRLEHELGIIIEMGFSGYFLIVADFVRWAKSQGIPVGPGRGSGAGSVAAYALGITELDPVEYDLLFERFLNPERVSMPDFDIDFCMERRDEVIDYVARRYGRAQVAQIITHGTMAAKAVVRDVGRVLSHPYGFVDQIAKLIPFELNMTLERALAEEPALKARYDEEEDVRALIDLAMQLEGITRNAGRHAGGVVIAPDDLTRFMPLFCEPGGTSPVTQFDMGDVEGIGLVKFDFLGLRTLTIIEWAVQNVNAVRRTTAASELAILDIPLDDTPAFELVRAARTTAVFQLESRGMKELIKRLEPDRFDDLIALVALFRPGPLQSGMVDDFIDRKHGRKKVEYLHPALEPILDTTYGVILYQEQVMQIAQALAGYSLGGADLLRRAMGKKKPEEMAKQRRIFMEGALENGIDEQIATTIFDLMEKFAGYGFNKSHSAAYALVAYQTAWLKANHPGAFMAAVMSADLDSTEKLVGLRQECLNMGLVVDPPHVNRGDYRFTLGADGEIVYGLGAVRGVGQGAVETIVEARDRAGEFSSLSDLCLRTDAKRLNRRALESLIKAGALDGLGENRASLAASLDHALGLAEQNARSAAVGQVDLFGLDASAPAAPVVAGGDCAMPEWDDDLLLRHEKEALGWYLSGHPFNASRPLVEGFVTSTNAAAPAGQARLAGIITGLRKQNTRRGKMAIVTIEDHTGQAEVVVYSSHLETFAPLLRMDAVIAVEGQCSEDDRTGGVSIIADQILDVADLVAQRSRVLLIRFADATDALQRVRALKPLLEERQGGKCQVAVEYHRPDLEARILFGDDWRISPSLELVGELHALFGRDAVKLMFPGHAGTLH